jgi:hypothetical protein
VSLPGNRDQTPCYGSCPEHGPSCQLNMLLACAVCRALVSGDQFEVENQWMEIEVQLGYPPDGCGGGSAKVEIVGPGMLLCTEHDNRAWSKSLAFNSLPVRFTIGRAGAWEECHVRITYQAAPQNMFQRAAGAFGAVFKFVARAPSAREQQQTVQVEASVADMVSNLKHQPRVGRKSKPRSQQAHVFWKSDVTKWQQQASIRAVYLPVIGRMADKLHTALQPTGKGQHLTRCLKAGHARYRKHLKHLHYLLF